MSPSFFGVSFLVEKGWKNKCVTGDRTVWVGGFQGSISTIGDQFRVCDLDSSH